LGYEAVQSLLDRALPDNEYQAIIGVTSSSPGVKGVHDLRTRQFGPTCFIQLHREIADSLSLLQAHILAEQVEQVLLHCFSGADIIIHLDPNSMVPTRRQWHQAG